MIKDKCFNNFDAYNTAIIDYLRNATSMQDVVLVLQNHPNLQLKNETYLKHPLRQDLRNKGITKEEFVIINY